MVKNYLLTALRYLVRYRSVSILNVLGLSLGIAVCVIIFLYVSFETSFDNYHPYVDRVYRIEKISNIYNEVEKIASVPNFIGDEVRGYEEVEYLCRIGPWRSTVVRYGDIAFKESGIFSAEPEFFRIFGIQVLEGTPATSMSRPFTVVLTETTAHKYFGDGSGLGKTIQIDTNYYEVVGIVKDFPYNTHARLNIMFSEVSLNIMGGMPEEVMRGRHEPTYVRLYPWVDPDEFGKRIYDLAHELEPELFEQRGEDMKCFLRPVRDIHMHANQLKWDVEPGGNPVFLYMISVIGFLILLITCFNYMNLSTAQYSARSLEVGIRKTVGATRKKLVRQFIGESVIVALLAHIIGMFLVEFSLPALNRLGRLSLDIHYRDPAFILFLLSVVIVIGLLAGSYPAFFLSSFKPVAVIKGIPDKRGKGDLIRRILVTGQYVISITLIIATVIVFKQLLFMKNQALGFVKQQKLIIEFPENQVTQDNYKFVKEQFLAHSGIHAAAISSSVPGRWRYWWRMWPTGEAAEKTRMMNCLQVDYDFIPVYGLKLVAGRAFDPSLSDSSNRGMILNESAVAGYGWESPEVALTKSINRPQNPVQGVFKNYHFKGLQNTIEPLGMFLIEDDFRYITLVFEPAAVEEVLSFSEAKFKELFPEGVFDYFFLDEDFELQYQQEEMISKLVLIFTILGIIIACLGLIGMISFSLENFRKEIGIRKVNGAQVKHIYGLLIRNFSWQILTAFLIASPVAWFGARTWLRDFAYSTEPSWWIFIAAGILAWVFALVAVSAQSIRAAGENPVKALRYE